MDDSLLPATIQQSLHHIGTEPVILDSDLARFFGVETKRLNEAVRRNLARFEGYSFQLDAAEAAALRSQPATSTPPDAEPDLRPQSATSSHGGRRHPPRVFTEHGVVMAATVLNSDRAVRASRRIIEAFVAMKRAQAPAVRAGLDTGFLSRLRGQMERLMQAEIDTRTGKTVQTQTQEFITEGLANLRARLQKSGLENEEIEARILRTLAEADESRARAATAHELTAKQRLKNQANALRLMIEAELALSGGEIGVFLAVLKDLGED